ncbi:efflux RND transporter permease subunit [Collimonas humicola]|uniref:efflux RND transporter permease subunit n=1 Tax=Collimonas humicola TaxID=2825886 RepID=UPI001B8D43C5|nr:MMPL family transporter [Collimonas humicola]
MRKFTETIIRFRWLSIVATLLLTVVLAYFASGLRVVIDPTALNPQSHPFTQSTKLIDKVFGSEYLVLIGVTATEGDIFQPAVLQRVKQITDELEATPGVVKSTLVSLAAPQAKNIHGTSEGFEARPLLGKTDLSEQEQKDLRAALKANPVYMNTIVSPDFKTAAILVELKERSDGFAKMVAPVKAIVDAQAGPEVKLTMGGNSVYLDKSEEFAGRMGYLFPIAVLVIGLLHFEAFRSKQGLILPLVTAILGVIWGLGIMGALGQQLDIFNSPTPILILAIAAGHAVQLLKRYYEEYERLRQTTSLAPQEANKEAVIRSMVGVGPVMLIAGGIAAISFFSLQIFDLSSVRAFGLFTGIGIVSAVMLEMTFIPAVRSLLRAPNDKERAIEAKLRIWDRIPRWIGRQVLSKKRRKIIGLCCVLLVATSAFGISHIVVNNASRIYFADDLKIRQDDDFLNRQIGGTNSLYLMIDAGAADGIKDPAILRGMDRLQQFVASQPNVGKIVSIVDYIKRMNQAMHADAADEYRIPASRELVSQYLLLYSMSGQPDDFNAYVDYNYSSAKMTVLLKTGNTDYLKQLIGSIQAKAADEFGDRAKLMVGGDVALNIALTDTMVNGKTKNIIQIAIVIFLVSALVFRSLTVGLIVLAPLFVTILVIFGTMGLFGIPMNIPNSLFAAMAVGIGADYAIYLLYRFREQIKSGEDIDGAIQHTLASAGKAILFVATAVAGGYSVLSLSIGYLPHLWLAIFIVLGMFVSAFASLFLVPTLIISLRPKFIYTQTLPADLEERAAT